MQPIFESEYAKLRAGSEGKTSAQLIREQSEAKKQDMRDSEQKMKKMLTAVVEKGRERPTLVESYDVKEQVEHQREMGAARRFYDILVKSGLKHEEAMMNLTAQEVRLLEEFNEHEKRRKEATSALYTTQ